MKHICLFFSVIIIARLCYLQLMLYDQYGVQSQKNYVRFERIKSIRGDILDCNGQKIVTNKPIIHVYWHGTGNRYLTEEQRATVAQLACLSEQIRCDEQLIGTLNFAERKNRDHLLLCDVSFEQLSKIEEQFAYHPNIHIQTAFKRYYPFNNMASHLMGYLSNVRIEAIGKMGLEKAFQETLQGKDGTLLKTINSCGKHISHKELKKSASGKPIQTTLDIQLQQLIEEAFPPDKIGTFIVMDPENGSVKALVSRPDFDPSIFLDPLHPDQWQVLQEKKPFLNRAIHCSYPPGSLFKLITISAALEKGLIKQDDLFICNGFIPFGNRNYWCNRHYGHGTISIMQGLALSCNILFYELGKHLSIDTLADYAYRFGLGQKTGFLLADKSGLVPTVAWKEETKGQRWWPGETLSASIGQSFLLTTPMQIARMISAIFTGYLIKPRILVDEAIECKPLQIQPETIDFLKRSMRSVVNEGTGRRVSRIKDFTIYAKTSTAQVSTKEKRHLGSQYFEHGWVVVYFTYKNNKPLTLVVLIEHAGTSRIPIMIAKHFLLKYRALYA